MGHDVMKSAANLIPDLLAFSHVLLYHGQARRAALAFASRCCALCCIFGAAR